MLISEVISLYCYYFKSILILRGLYLKCVDSFTNLSWVMLFIVVMFRGISKFWQDHNGATAIEYGLIASLIAVALIGALTALGDNASDTFDKVAQQMA